MNNNNRHIFFVDDELKVRQVVGETLEQLGLQVSCFACAAECLERLPGQRCDLLITDLRLPEMDGVELLKRARLAAPWIPVLILTGYGDIPTAVEAIKAGAVDFIEKPLDKQSLVRKVMSLLPENGNHQHTGKPLTRSEQKVLQLVLDGKSNREIASLLRRSQRTIEVHRAHMMRKLGASSLIDLIKRAAAMGLTDLGASLDTYTSPTSPA